MTDTTRLPIRVVLFDLDGTLVDSAPDLQTAANRVLADEGRRPLELAEVVNMIGDGVPKLVERSFAATGTIPGADDLETLSDRFLRYYEGHEADLTVPYPGVEAALMRLRDAGYVMAVCTNKPHAPALGILAQLGIGGYFQVVIGGDSIPGVKKPDPRHLQAAIEALGATADETVMVGDNANDVKAARATGIPVIVAEFGYTKVAPADLGADLVMSSFDELPHAFDRLP